MFLLYNISNLWHTLKTKDDDILTNNGNEENNHVFKYQTVKNKDRANKMQFVIKNKVITNQYCHKKCYVHQSR